VPGAAAIRHASEKKTVHATERDSPRVHLARRRYRRKIAKVPAKKLTFVDESGLNIAMTRRYGRAMRGQRVHDAVPKNFGRNVTILVALSWYGLDALMMVDGATDAEVFRTYVSRVLAPTLRPGDVVVMDNLSAHKVSGIEAAITNAGARLIYLPPLPAKCRESSRSMKVRTPNPERESGAYMPKIRWRHDAENAMVPMCENS
jgi:hypothetical protein